MVNDIRYMLSLFKFRHFLLSSFLFIQSLKINIFKVPIKINHIIDGIYLLLNNNVISVKL